jgi:azurin
MKTVPTVLAIACALALAACDDRSATTDAAGTATTPAPAATGTAPAPVAETPAATPAPVATAPAGSDKPAAVVADCATEVEGTDAMQFNVGSITIPASCTDFKITLKHTGQQPVTVMGHNIVVAAAADMQGIETDGIAAGAANDYVKPGDTRVIAHTRLVGGGQSDSVSFPVSKLRSGGPFEFFCSFPGHAAIMKGTISVG